MFTVSIAASALMVAAAASPEEADVEVATLQPDIASDVVVVTVRRRPEDALAVPIAVTALEGAEIEKDQINDVQDLQRQIAALQTSQISRDDTIVVMRGQGPGVGAFPGVLTYLNEVPFRGLGEGFYYDLASIQVLKGPQGTLFGRNANGGAILFGAAVPEAEFGGHLQATLGNYDARELQGALNLPVAGDQVMARVAGLFSRREGYTRVATGGEALDDRNVAAGRLSLRLAPTASVRNDLMTDYARVDTNGTSAILLGLNPQGPLALLPPEVQAAAAALLAQQQALGPRTQVGTSTDTVRQSEQWGVQDRLEVDLSDTVKLRNIAAYRRYQLLFRADYDGTPLPLLDFSITPDGQTTDEEQISEELQLLADLGSVTLTAGAYYQQNRPAGEQRQIGTIFFQPILQISDADDLSRALYAQVDYDADAILPGLSLSAGGRYTWDRRQQSAATVNLASGTCGAPGAVPPGCLLSDTVRFDAPSWSLAATYEAAPETYIYVTSRHSYKSGGLNLNQPFAAARVYAPEYITDVEIGIRSSLSLGAAELDVAANVYRGDYSDVQVNALVADTENNAIFNIVENGAEATLSGAELDALLRLPGGVSLGLSYAYTDAHYDRFISTIYGDLSDAPWPYTSEHKGSATAAWTLPVAEEAGRPTLAAHLSFQTESTFGYDPDPFTGQPGYALLDLDLDWSNVLGAPLDLGIFVNNATDKLYRTGVIGLFNTIGLSSGIYGPPRTYGLRVRMALGEGNRR